MKLMILGNIYSIHTRRWVSYLARNHEIYLVYIPEIFKENVSSLFQEDILRNIHLLPLFNPICYQPIRIHRYIIRKISYKEAFYKIGLNTLKRYIKQIKPDLVHVHHILDYGCLASLTDFHPLVFTAWGGDIAVAPVISPKLNKAVRYALEKADIVHTGDDAGRKRLLELGCESQKIFIQPWGVDTDVFSPQSRSEKLRGNLLGDTSKFLVSCVRGQIKVYNIPVLLKAIPLVVSEKKETIFVIVGGGDKLEEHKDMACQLGVEKFVKFMGYVEHEKLHPIVASSDVYVDPYYLDVAGAGISVSLMDAMSCALPVVVARRPGLEDAVKEGKSGLMFQYNDEKELAEKLLWLLNRPDKMASFGQENRNFAIKNGDWEKNMSVFEELYMNLANHK